MLKSRSSVAKLRHLIYKSLELNEKVADKYVHNADMNTTHAGTQRADKLIIIQKENHKAAIS